ncbi:MAG TPA: TetR family transcriptional regulator [Acidimicrobiales bacterium]|nr:TetR family transcriptional regulator [Acidimicrobiales bacterium]
MKYVVEAANGLRERKKARTREAIIDAALDLFARKGFDATTVEDIAAAADVSPRTFFRYFDSKLDLVMARNEAHGEKLGPLIEARPPEEGPLEALRHVLRAELSERLADPASAREFQVMCTTPTLRNMAREHFQDEEAELARAFATRLGVAQDDLTAHVLAATAISAAWTVVDRWIAAQAPVERLLPMIDDAFDLLDRGLSSARPPARRGGRAGPARKQSRQARQPQP